MFSDKGPVRLLPWTGVDGRPNYLIGGGNGRVSRMADEAERTQLAMAADLLEHVEDLRKDGGDGEEGAVTPEQLAFVNACLEGSLRDVCRIAESRGRRLADLAGAHDTTA
ncbi:hypothetical protein RM780_25620 [Streptomyces sp. DSM 44917]|uniref:Uncharacterized protein n=1 Tax=Streptomyces boetiae TaxID=3075541 RepID=A0ABU2LFK0_9ACTN|nr:hypothetical protein [Streptomyces sp. DSM 44917]MDT0310302.1 hypothetical protein [Streptomyces sp. DSM 44917]